MLFTLRLVSRLEFWDHARPSDQWLRAALLFIGLEHMNNGVARAVGRRGERAPGVLVSAPIAE